MTTDNSMLHGDNASSSIIPSAPPKRGEASRDDRPSPPQPYTNFVTGVVKLAEAKEDGTPKTKRVTLPLFQGDIRKTVHARLDDFPRVLGNDTLFVPDNRDEAGIRTLDTPTALTSWINGRFGCNSAWRKGTDSNGVRFTTEAEMHEEFLTNSRRYDMVCTVPHEPARKDVYYLTRSTPDPDPNCSVLEKLVDFFSPMSADYRVLIKAAFIAGLANIRERPCFTVVSNDIRGVGKTSLVEMIGRCYGGTIDVSRNELSSTNMVEFKKRILSAEARSLRIVLVDNVLETMAGTELAGLITRKVITGRCAYGKGETARRNDLTFFLTANGLKMDEDMKSRSILIRLRPPADKNKAGWASTVEQYIDDHLWQFVADGVAMIRAASARLPIVTPRTRFPEFEQSVLAPVCKDRAEFDRVRDLILADQKAVDSELAERNEAFEALNDTLRETRGYNPKEPCFLDSKALDKLRWSINHATGCNENRVMNVNQLKDMLRKRPEVAKTIERWPEPSGRRGLMIFPEGETCLSPSRTYHVQTLEFLTSFSGSGPFHVTSGFDDSYTPTKERF